MQSNHSTPQDAMEAPTRPPAPRDVPPPASLPIDGFPQPLPALTAHLSAILAHLFESATLCQGKGDIAPTRLETDAHGRQICPAFDAAAQLGATLLLRRGLRVGFGTAHSALETARAILRCPRDARTFFFSLADELAGGDPRRERQYLVLELAEALYWHDVAMERDEEYRAEHEGPLAGFARVHRLSEAQVAALLPAAQALHALERATESPQAA